MRHRKWWYFSRLDKMSIQHTGVPKLKDNDKLTLAYVKSETTNIDKYKKDFMTYIEEGGGVCVVGFIIALWLRQRYVRHHACNANKRMNTLDAAVLDVRYVSVTLVRIALIHT